MNRPLFRLTGVVALVLMVPYFFSAIPLFGYLFFGGMVIGILWCMFAIEYRGVWFGPEDPGVPQKFREEELPILRTIGMEIQKRTKERCLYAWDLVLRPIRMPDGERLYNIRYDFVPSSDGPLELDPAFDAVELTAGVPLTLSLRAGLREEKVFLMELEVNRRHPLSGPANRKVSPLDLKNSDPALKAVAEAVLPALPKLEGVTWGVAFLEYVRSKRPFLRVGIEVLSSSADAEFRFAGAVFPLKKGKVRPLEFRMDPRLKSCYGAGKPGAWKRLMSFGN